MELVAIGGEVVTAVDVHEIKIKKSGRVIWGRCAKLTFEVINGIVVRGKDEKFGTLFVETDGAGGKVRDDCQNTDDSGHGRGLEVDGVLCQVWIPMDDTVARAVVWVVAHVVVKSRFLDFCGLVLIVSVFHIVVFEAMEMWVMGCHLGEVGIGRAPKRLWENEAECNAASGGHAFSLVHG